jgi:uncharacterized protein (DUF1330 family)
VHRLIAVLVIKRSELAAFRDFEHHAARIMRRHGGELEHAYELAGDGETLRELHVVAFPSQDAFDAYRADPELATRAPDRARAVISTEIWPATELRY